MMTLQTVPTMRANAKNITRIRDIESFKRYLKDNPQANEYYKNAVCGFIDIDIEFNKYDKNELLNKVYEFSNSIFKRVNIFYAEDSRKQSIHIIAPDDIFNNGLFLKKLIKQHIKNFDLPVDFSVYKGKNKIGLFRIS